MNRFASALLGLALLSAASYGSALIDPSLGNFARSQGTQRLRVIAAFEIGPDEATPPQRYDSRNVKIYLHYRATKAWQEVAASLRQQQAFNGAVQPVTLHDLSLSMSFDVTPAGLKLLAATPGIVKIYNNRQTAFDPGAPDRFAPREQNVPWDWNDINLTKLIDEHPEIDGHGVMLGLVDTGVDGTHPALQGKIAAFYNAANNTRGGTAVDPGGHGTHVSGTMLGGDRTKITIGMAPGARLTAASALGDYDQMLKGMAFVLDPDGNPATDDHPRAVNNSWHCPNAPDIELFYRAIAAWEAAGILPVFAAGNSGPNPHSITHCGDSPVAFSVGATGPDGMIASFSSRGPATVHGAEVQKPEITAPGMQIYSSIPGGKYTNMQGTSMASPHVTGAVALLLQANPKLNPAQLRAILVKTARPTSQTGAAGSPGVWNANYGFGKLDILAAVHAALGLQRPRAFSGFLMSSVDLEDGALADLVPSTDLIESMRMPARFEQSGWLTLNDLE